MELRDIELRDMSFMELRDIELRDMSFMELREISFINKLLS
jgi:hypothetical protein